MPQHTIYFLGWLLVFRGKVVVALVETQNLAMQAKCMQTKIINVV